MSKKISMIVLTGGPCAGKTSALSRIRNVFSKWGYDVLIMPETATELITGGVAPWTCESNIQYQILQMKMQLLKEGVFCDAAQAVKGDKVLIICDRGALDNKAYMSQEDFQKVLDEMGMNEVELRDSYDAVLHLVTAAKGAEEFYTTAGHAARKESVEEAAALDDALIAAWTGHPHLRVIDNSGDFEDKLRRVIAEIAAFLGEPEPMEIERKFLIRYPDLNWLEGLDNCERVEIIQTYLVAGENEEVRVRQRGSDGHFTYYETRKKAVTGLKRVEVERRLSRDEYIKRLIDADTSRRQIRKTRYCLTYDAQYLEIDVYPFWNDQAILEVELRSEDQEIRVPEQLEIIREVTEDEAYKNASLASAEVTGV